MNNLRNSSTFSKRLQENVCYRDYVADAIHSKLRRLKF